MKKKDLILQAGIIIIGILLFVPGLGAVHLFDWDEINFAESAREMLVSGNYLDVQINFHTFWEKPPLFIWLQVLSMKIFGINEFAARFPNAVCGICTLLVLFNIGRRLKGSNFGLLWVLLYAGSVLPFFYFKSGIIDPWFNLFIFCGVYYFIRYTDGDDTAGKTLMAALSGFFLGLAILTKGPVGFLIFLLTFVVYLFWNRLSMPFRWKDVAVFIVMLCLMGGLWFILQLLNGNYSVIRDFIVYQIRLFQTQDAGHGGFPLYHFVILFFGVFPASIIALPAFSRKILVNEQSASTAHFFRWMMMMFWVVLLLFSIVRTKIIHYSSACYFPLTFLAAYVAWDFMQGKRKLPKYIGVMLLCLSVVYALAILAITQFDKFKGALVPHIADEFAVGNMQATATWHGFEAFTGLLLLAGAIAYIRLTGKRKDLLPVACLSAGTMLFMFVAVRFVAPQVEKYSQAAAIEFYESKKGEDCYIYTPYFKSYAHYFYSDRQPANNMSDGKLLLRGQLDKPCYIAMKDTQRNRVQLLNDAPDAELLYRKNGFAFYRRMPKPVPTGQTDN